ncbi:MAG: NAD(P)/FAD-dependent oxidoreductase [Nitrospinota bacterium]|nr:MAG: NAD(P)/FAD-dependent oxidoreductase [Nitrospinota bacterium]
MREVVVVGGGPAGAASATFLAQQGVDVLLLERAMFPRNKPCGEFLTPGTLRLFRALGVAETVAAQAQPVRCLLLIAPQGERVEHQAEGGDEVGFALCRAVLDALLLNRARASGVEVWEGFAVRGVLREEERVVGVWGIDARGIRQEIRAHLVIGADGTHSLVARELDLVRPLPLLQRIALVSHWPVDTPGDTLEMRVQGGTVCGMGFPAPRLANVTLVVPRRQAPEVARRGKGAFLEEQISRLFPDLSRRLSAGTGPIDVWTIGCFGHRAKQLTADGVLLVGDAATFIDPFTGEGVYLALRGAELAGEVAGEALRRGDTRRQSLIAYERRRQELRRRYLLCALIQAIVRSPGLMNIVVRWLRSHHTVRGRLMKVLGDVSPPEALLKI